jgi:hypothetical protein
LTLDEAGITVSPLVKREEALALHCPGLLLCEKHIKPSLSLTPPMARA